MYTYWKKHKQTVQDALVLCGAVLLCILLLRYLFPIILPFLLGWLLSLAFCPLADYLERLRIPRWLGTLFCILLLLSILGLLVALVGNQLVDQVTSFLHQLPQVIATLQKTMDHFWEWMDGLLFALPDIIQDSLTEVKNSIVSIVLSLVQSTGSSSLTTVPHFLLGFLITLLSAYFFTKDNKNVHAFYMRHVQPLFGPSLERSKQELKTSIVGYLKTQVILMLYTFCITIVGMLILQSPFALLLAIVIAIIDALPFFGSGFILWPGAVIHLVLGDIRLAVGYLIIYAAVQIMRQIMQPKILGTQIGLHPLLTLFSMYFGYRTIGFWGLIIGPIFAVLLRAYFQTREHEENHTLEKEKP